MKRIHIAIITISILLSSCTTNEYEYPADLTLNVEFKNTSKTLHSQVKADNNNAKMSIYLPENYTSDKKYPLLLWLNGGDGGTGLSLEIPKGVTSNNDFICVNFPLFKKHLDSVNADSSNYWNRMYLDNIESETIWNQYKIMLDRLYKIIPNIDTENTFMGGFSNGAHTTAILLNRENTEIKKYFKNFYFIEGGETFSKTDVLKEQNALFMLGEKTDHSYINPVILSAKKSEVNVETYIMKGVGHNIPSEHYSVLKNWLFKNIK